MNQSSNESLDDENEITGGVTVSVGGDPGTNDEDTNYVLYSFLGLLGIVIIVVVIYFVRML